MRLPVPKRVQERLAPLVERTQAFLKTWEWTWTSAVVASMVIAFVTLTFTVFIPSWWLYFADQNLRWRSFWQLKLRDAPVGHFFDVITNGYGSMPDYRAEVPPRDRWAIVAYIRALQRSQHATLKDVPPAERPKLEGGQP